MQIIVIGCGVSGLSSGVRLLEAGHSVAIWARELPPNTTSNIAAAIWHPYKAFPLDRVIAWGRRSFEVFGELADVPGTGVSFVEALELFREEVPDPDWRDAVRDFRRTRAEELLEGCVTGYSFQTFLVETSIYLDYLMVRFQELGGSIAQRELASLSEALAESQVVVNCAGLGARSLAQDEELFPIRGELVRIEPLPIGRVMLDEDESRGVTYIVPRSSDCILGGTAEVGNWSLDPDMNTAQAIIERCAELSPEVRNARVLGHLVGLRPGRYAVRLEAEPQPGGGLAVHNYGHGGAGITLSWGCAEEVAEMVTLYAQGTHPPSLRTQDSA
jgi:D-amino-acid oxidase